MPSPFPGMDPYVERPAIWPDFHNRLITFICGALQPLLKPKYVALSQERLFVVESNRPIYPDVSVLPSGAKPNGGGGTAVATLEADTPALFELWYDEINEALIHIVEPAAGERVVTAIEVISPDNKAGAGRDGYREKREELRQAGANLVEIDLLRDGAPIAYLSEEHLDSLPPWRYLVTVTRRKPLRQEVYPIPLQRRLPKVKVPLAEGDADVTLDLQAVFTRCWDEGPYPALLRYGGLPPGTMTADEQLWCEGVLKAASYRPATA
jgi:hypothetical protein